MFMFVCRSLTRICINMLQQDLQGHKKAGNVHRQKNQNQQQNQIHLGRVHTACKQGLPVEHNRVKN